jgi:hypothetical protein
MDPIENPIEWESYWECLSCSFLSESPIENTIEKPYQLTHIDTPIAWVLEVFLNSLLRVLLNESYWESHWMNIERVFLRSPIEWDSYLLRGTSIEWILLRVPLNEYWESYCESHWEVPLNETPIESVLYLLIRIPLRVLLRSPTDESYWESHWMNIGSCINSLLRILLNWSYLESHWMSIEIAIESLLRSTMKWESYWECLLASY